MRTCVIVNPNAGSAGEADTFNKLLAPLGDVTVRHTHAPGDAESHARQAVAEGFDRVIAAGGDGTVNDVVNGIAPHFDRAVFGILPLGTGNDFARMLDLPLDDPAAAVAALAMNRERRVDLVRVRHDEPRYLLNTAGAGFTAKVGENIDSRVKEWWGSLAYIWGAAKTLPELDPYHLRLELDGEPVEIDAYTLVISNGRYIGGGIPIAPEAEIDDGLLDVLILPALPVTRLAVLVPQILAGKHEDADDLVRRRAAMVRVGCAPEMPFNVDGEPIGHCPADFIVEPRKLRILHGGN